MTRVISKPGVLHIVATPIGNLDDITRRALEILSMVDLVAAEDTRHSANLLTALGLSKPLLSLHEHNEAARAAVLLEKLRKGKNIALISDAGTPLISDPGFRLVDMAHQNGIRVVPIPGPSSVAAAVSVAGISTACYTFVGFLPAKHAQRTQMLNKLKTTTNTLVFFESPHRIDKCLSDMVDRFGGHRQACLCREMTKQFETIFRASLHEIQQFVAADQNQRRGEIVLVVSGASTDQKLESDIDAQELLKSMIKHMPAKTAAALLSKHFGRSRRHYYQMALDIKKTKSE